MWLKLLFNLSYGLICQFDKWGNKPYNSCSRKFCFYSKWSIVCFITCLCVDDVGQCDLCAGFVCFSQFSKEKYLLESPPEKLRKELEEELKLSSSDMRSHGWYHGHIPREVRLWVKFCNAMVQCSLSQADRILIKRHKVWSTLQPILA